MRISRIFCFSIVLLALSAFARAQSKVDQKILATETSRFDCMTRADTAALRPMLASDLFYVHSNALTENKSEHLAAIATGRLVYQNITRETVRVRRYGKIALTNGAAKVKGILNGTAFETRLLYTATYRKRRGGWQLINWQSTRIP